MTNMASVSTNESTTKTIWFLVRRFDLAAASEVLSKTKQGQKPPVTLRKVDIPNNCSSAELLQSIRSELSVAENNIVLKLRNSEGSLIIPKGSIEVNTASTPYQLEVTCVHQNVKPKERSVHFPEHEKILQTTLESYVNRVERLEAEVSELTNRHQYRIEREVQDVARQLAFIGKRFKEAEDVQWSGTLKKNPLW